MAQVMDPMLKIITAAQLQGQDDEVEDGTEMNEGPSDFDDESNIHPDLRSSSSGQSTPNDTSLQLSRSRLQVCANAIKKEKNLPDAANVILDRFLKAPTTEERLLLLLGEVLALSYGKVSAGGVSGNTDPQLWSPGPVFKRTYKNWVKYTLLSSTAHSYIECSPERIILSAMREYKCGGLPDEEPANEAVCLALIGKELTNQRCKIKEVIQQTTDAWDTKKSQPPMAQRNIGEVAKTLIGSTVDIPITLALFYRLATIRWVVDNHPEALGGNGRAFWPKVDFVFKDLRTRARTSDILTRSFHGVYKEDVAKYGQSTVSAVDLVATPDAAKTFIQIINRHTGQAVQRTGLKRTAEEAGLGEPEQ